MQSSNRMRQLGLACLMTALVLLVFGQAQALAQGPTDEQLELGAQLYAENCAVCHGHDGQGRVGATLAKDWPSIRPDLAVQSVIENGISGSLMPAWSQQNGGPLTDEEIEAMTFYILDWQTGGIPSIAPTPILTPRLPITPVPDVEGDPNQGAVLYAENCAVCHGPNGEGRIGVTLSKDWPSIRPDLQAKAAIVSGISGSPMPAWSQEEGGPLTDQDINDIVAFMMTWEAPGAPVDLAPTPTPTTSSAFSGALGVVVLIVGIIAIVLVGVVGALRRGE